MKKIILLLLALSTLFAFCACTSGGEASSDESSTADVSTPVSTPVSQEESKEESLAPTFKVKVTDADGNAISGVMLQLCKDTCIPQKTAEDGVASFNAEITDGYKLSVLTCPAGYKYVGDAEIYLQSGITEYTIVLEVE